MFGGNTHKRKKLDRIVRRYKHNFIYILRVVTKVKKLGHYEVS